MRPDRSVDWDNKHRTGGQRIADTVEVDDVHRIGAVGGRYGLNRIARLDGDHEARYGRNAENLSVLERNPEARVRPRDLPDRNVKRFCDSFQGVAGLDLVVDGPAARKRRGRN